MSITIKASLILSTALIAAALIFGGIYTTTPGGGYFVVVVNKWTGSAAACSGGACWALERKASRPEAAPTPSANWGAGDPLYTEPAKP